MVNKLFGYVPPGYDFPKDSWDMPIDVRTGDDQSAVSVVEEVVKNDPFHLGPPVRAGEEELARALFAAAQAAQAISDL